MKLEAVFEVEGVEVAGNGYGKNAVRLNGSLSNVSGYANDPEKDGPDGTPHVALIVRTSDGQPPVKLGAKLKVTFTDEL